MFAWRILNIGLTIPYLIVFGITFSCVFLMPQALQADSKYDRNTVIKLLDEGNCSAAWNIIWSKASTGHKDALFDAAGAIWAHNLSMPGAPNDPVAQMRFILIFSAHSMNETNKGRDMVKAMSRNFSSFPGAPQRFWNCLYSDQPDSTCLNIAISDEVIPSFERFRHEVMNYQKDFGPMAACTHNGVK